ncbi:MAG: aldolase/citrate lyase family protein [Alphaproteobacteria bacterium]|nr:aldolase/citrate lyase family protein [Alphaproteobacteria bacterium]
MAPATYREMTKTRELKAGVAFLEFDSPGVGQIARAGGAEFAFIDMEHSGFGTDTVKRMLRYMQAADLTSLVRPPSKDYGHIARVLDIGADALLLQMTGSAEEIRQIVNYMKYPPAGQRGIALSIAHDRYRPGPAAEKLAAANDHVACVPLIETRDGIENIDEIAAVDGVDCLWIGHFDLSASLGIPGQFEHPDFKAAVDKVLAAAKKHNRSAGRMVGSVEEGIELYRAGFDMICYSGDVFLLQAAIESGITALRQGCE